ncbi:hypothetical protein [Fictibacillus sp. 7GRE50]|nr:hypothetical protein [Fictibacillus sp. 7GRE50]
MKRSLVKAAQLEWVAFFCFIERLQVINSGLQVVRENLAENA